MIIFNKIPYKYFWVILFLLLFLILPSNKALADNLSAGKEALDKNNLSQALDFFTAALKEKQDDPNRLYYLGLTLKKMGEATRANKAFNAALKLDPPAHLANQILSQIIITNNDGPITDNYFQDSIRNNQIFRWDLTKMPLKVFIAPGNNVKNYTPEYKQAVITSLNTWQSAMQNKIRFTLTDNAKNANIKIAWIDKLYEDKIGLCPYKFINYTIISSDVVLSTNMRGDRPKTIPEMYQVALHELGHALGIKGHSPNPNDVMYSSLNGESNRYLSLRDINTMRKLYRKEATISNNLPLNMENTKLFHKYNLQAGDYIKKKDYKNALDNYLSALKLYSNDFHSQFNTGFCYYKLNDTPNALKHYEIAKSLNPNNADLRYNLGWTEIDYSKTLDRNKDKDKIKEYYTRALENLQFASAKYPDSNATIEWLNKCLSNFK